MLVKKPNLTSGETRRRALKGLALAGLVSGLSSQGIVAQEAPAPEFLPQWVSADIPDTLHQKVPQDITTSSEQVQTLAIIANDSLTDPQLVDLALSLKNDPLLIFQYVYNEIDYEPTYGAVKGSLGSVLDKSANSFDQAQLLADLLDISGYDAKVLKVQIDKPDAEIFNWLKVDPTLPNAFNTMVNRLSLANGLNQLARVSGTKIRFTHAVVEVTVDGKVYRLDPSFKAHTQYTAEVDIASATGFDKSSFISQVAPGNKVNPSALKQSLTQMTQNLQQNLLANHYDKSTDQVLGGWEVIINEASSLPETQVAQVQATWEQIPSSHSSSLRIQYAGVNTTLASRDIYGKKLYLTYNASMRPELRLDETLLATGNTLTKGQPVQVSFNVDHAYGQNFGDQNWTQYLTTGGAYNIINAWGNVGEDTLAHYQTQLTELLFQGPQNDIQKSVYTLATMGINWLYDVHAGRRFNNRLHQTHTIGLHNVGISGTSDVTGQTGSPYVDVGGGFVAQSASPNTFVTGGMLSSAFEHGVINHTQDLDAVSTARLLDLAASQGLDFYQTNASNWSSVQSQLQAYSSGQLNLMQQYINAGFTLVVPNRGDLLLDSWQGSGYFTFFSSGSSMSAGYLINGGLKGGFSSTPAPVNSDKTSSFGQWVDNTWDALKSYDPINMSSGDFLFYGDDLTTGSGIAELNFSRNYNSANHRGHQGLGLGWKHNHSISARADTNIPMAFGQKSAIDAAPLIIAQFVAKHMLDDIDSQMIRSVVATASTYTWLMAQMDDNLVYFSQPDKGVQFTRLADGSYLSSQGMGDTLNQGSNGEFHYKDKHGLNYYFNADGNIGQIVDRNNNQINYQYSGGQLTGISNNFGRSLSLSYNANGLSSVTTDDGRLVSYQISDQKLASATNVLGHSTQYVYDDKDRLERVFTPEYPQDAAVFNVYNAWGKVKQQTSNIGGLHYYHIVPGYRAEEIGPLGFGYTAYFNDGGQVTRHINAENQLTRTEFDGLNRKVRVTYPEGNQDQISYDNRFNPISFTRIPKPGSSLSPLNALTHYSDDFNLPLWKQDAMGNKVEFAYDAQGNLTTTRLPLVLANGQSVRPESANSYLSNGLLSTQTDPQGVVTQFSYFNNGQLKTQVQDVGGLSLTTQYSYTPAGDIASLINPQGQTTLFQYDANRQLVLEQAPLGIATAYGYDKNGRQTLSRQKADNLSLFPTGWAEESYTYTRDDKPLTYTSSAGEVTHYSYNIQGQLTQQTAPDGKSQAYVYDSLQRQIETRVLDNGSWVTEGKAGYTPNGKKAWVQDANDNQTQYSYDGFDRLSQTQFADGSSSQSEYLASGAVSRFTDRSGTITSYQYDAINRLVTSQTGTEQKKAYSYNLQGHTTRVDMFQPAGANSAESVSFSYDNLGRVISTTNDRNQRLSYGYNKLGQTSELTFPDNKRVAYTYDGASRLQSVIYDGQELARYQHNQLSQPTSITRVNGANSQYQYQKSGQLASLSHTFNQGQWGYQYQHTATGQLSGKTYTGLARAWSPQVSVSTSYQSNNLNQYQSVGNQALSYTDNGSLQQLANQYQYGHNGLNQLISVEPAGINQRIVYSYDAMGRRKAKDSYGVFTSFLHDGGHIVAEYDAQQTLTQRYIYAPGMDRPIALIQGNNTYLYHTDELGSVVALSDASGALAESYSYSPFGLSQDISLLGNPLRYTARRLESDTGLYYYRARDYHPGWGRFIQPDPLGYADGMNVYAYVGNDPLNYIDPTGLYGQGALDTLGGAADEFSMGLTSGITDYLGVNKTSTEYMVGSTAAMLNPKGLITKVGKEALEFGAKKFVNGNTVKEGIYEFTDTTGKKYVGQSVNVPNRLKQHIKSGKLDPNQGVTTTQVLGGKTAREIAEHKRIQEITGGVPARFSDKVSNKVDPIGPKRRHLLDQ